MDPGIPGSSTFAKPVDEIRQPENNDESIHKVDNADDLTKDQTSTPMDERDHSDFKPNMGSPGRRDPNDESKTKYPYRDGIPNAHNASAVFVAGLYLASIAPEMVVVAGTRLAVRISDILRGLNPSVIQKSTSCAVTLKRVDPKNLRWVFSVEGGHGPKVVKLKATRKGNVTKLSKMDMVISCSCPAWRWLGSEHHAKQQSYLDGKPAGTASAPVVKDPDGVNRVCKHVAAVLGHVQGWEVGRPKNASENESDEGLPFEK